MSDQTLQLLEKLFVQMQDMKENMATKQDISELRDKVDQLDTRLGSVETKVDQLDTRLGSVETKVDQLDTRLGSLETKVDHIDARTTRLEAQSEQLTSDVANLGQQMVRIEQHMYDNFAALHDGYQQNSQKLIVLESKIDAIGEKVDRQEVEIRVIKNAK